MKSLPLYLGMVIIGIFMMSCSDSSHPPRVPSTPSEGPDFCAKVQSSSNAALTNSGIKTLINDICTNVTDIGKVLYNGSGVPNVKVITESEESDNQSKVYYQGGLRFNDVSAKLYFSMMKTQAECGDNSKCEISKSNGYEMDETVTEYSPKVSGSTIKYSYKKEIESASETTEYEYEAIADFITIEENSLYVVTNRLDKKGEVKNMFSVTIITGDTASSKAYMGMTQTANNHGNHDNSVAKSVKFFKEDAQRSYNNALVYKKRNS